MFECYIFGFVLFFGFSLNDVSGEPVDIPVTRLCLGCLCHASSGCNTTVVECIEGHCGPYRVTAEYWVDSGSPTYDKMPVTDFYTFKSCAYNYYCSAFIIQGYMEKHKKDCNGDGKINCDDYAALHSLGSTFDRCNNTLPNGFRERYEGCKARFTH